MTGPANDPPPAPRPPCATQGCGGEAVVVAAWPGKTVLLCRPCAENARRVADALGFELVLL